MHQEKKKLSMVNFFISTEGALRLLSTYDNHSIQPIPFNRPTYSSESSKQA